MDHGSIHYVHTSAASITQAARLPVIARFGYVSLFFLSSALAIAAAAAAAAVTAARFPERVTVHAIYNA